MRIDSIEIKNFKSVRYAEIKPANFSSFVGQNNHGKTNLFDAIEYFYDGLGRSQRIEDIRFNDGNTDEVSVKIVFSDLTGNIDSMLNDKNRVSIKNALGDNNQIAFSRVNGDKLQVEIAGTVLEKNPLGIDNATKDFLPRLEYIDTKKYFDDVGKYDKKTPVGIMLSSVLETVIEKSTEYSQLKEKFIKLFEDENSDVHKELKSLSSSISNYLIKQFPDCSSVRFEITPPEFTEYLKNFETKVDDGIETPVHEKGDGMQRALMLAIIQAYADFRKDDLQSKSFLFLIDEAELHLHPMAQRKLKSALQEICDKGDQVFVNTHSSVLVSDKEINETIFRVEKIDGATNVYPVSSSLEKQNIVYDLLGGTPSDLLLPDNFIIVEGETEEIFLEGVISRFYNDMPNIKILRADGYSREAGRVMNAIRKLYSPINSIYGDKVVILLDDKNKDNAKELENFKAEYKSVIDDGRFFQLPKARIEDYYPAQFLTKLSADKVKNARYVVENISRNSFETDMEVIFKAMQKCWEKAFNSSRNNNADILVQDKEAA